MINHGGTEVTEEHGEKIKAEDFKVNHIFIEKIF
jgi:hypothetical protein